MKKVLLLGLIILSHFAYSQNQEMINKMSNSKSVEEIRLVADNIVSMCKNKYNFLKVIQLGREDELYEYVIYTSEGMTPAEIKEVNTANLKNCFVVKFKQFYKGENKDLDVKGELTYFFKEVTAKYLDLIGFWTSTFYPNATKELVLEDYKLQEYRVDKDLKYKLKKEYDNWTLVKSY